MVIEPGTPRQRALFGYLGLRAGTVVPTESLVDLLWGDDPPATAVKTVQAYLSRLRRATGLDLPGDGTGYRLDLDADEVDAIVMERELGLARAAMAARSWNEADRHFEAALGLWRSDPLTELPDSHLARVEATHLVERFLTGSEDHHDCLLELGRHTQLVAEVERFCQANPTRERAWAQLMTALYRSGRQADALRAYQRARTTLADELGLEPGPDLVELEARILDRDPTLFGDQTGQESASTAAARAVRPGSGSTSGPAESSGDGRREVDGHGHEHDGPNGEPVQEAVRRALAVPVDDPAPFHGRRAEREELLEWFHRPGGPRLRFVTGEPGIGKTAMLEAVAAELGDRAITVRGRCSPGLTVSYQPMIEATRDLFARCPSGWVRWLGGPDGGLLTYLLPELSEALGPPPAVHPDVVEQRVLGTAFDLFARVANMTPMLLLIDDIMWASENTMAIVRHAMRQPSLANLRVLATHRAVLDDDDSPFRRARAELVALDQVSSMVLGGLDDRSAGEMLAGRGLDDQQVERITTAAGGHPLFLTALAGSAGEGDRSENSTGSIDGASVAADIADTIRRWAEPIPADLRTVLAQYAVLGGGIDDAVAAEILDIDPDRLLDALDAGEALGLLSEAQDGTTVFRHDLVRTALAAEIPTRRRRRHHARAFQLFRTRLGDSLAAEAVHHGALAGSAVAADDLADAAVAAADAARVRGARDDEADLLAIGLAALRSVDAARAAVAVEIKLGAAQLAAGRAAFGDTRRSVMAGLDAVGDDELTIEAALVLGHDHSFGDVDHDRLELLTRARALASDDHPDRPRILAALATAGWATLPAVERRDLIDSALTAVSAGDRRRTQVIETVLWPLTEPSTAQRRDSLGQELAAAAIESGSQRSQVLAINARLGAAVELADGGAVESLALQFAAAAERARLPATTVMERSAAAGLHAIAGRLDAAEVAVGELLTVAAAAGFGEAETLGPVARPMFQVAWDRGTLGDFEPITAARADEVPEWPSNRISNALAKVCADADGAESAVRDLLGRVGELSDDMGLLFNLHALTAAADLLAVDPGPAGPVMFERLMPFADRFEWSGSASFGPVRLALAQLERLAGRPTAAVQHIEAGLALCDELGAAVWTARLLRESALVGRLLGIAVPGEPGRARPIAEAAGAHGLVARLTTDGL